jgi:hypothetical protein
VTALVVKRLLDVSAFVMQLLPGLRKRVTGALIATLFACLTFAVLESTGGSLVALLR